MDETKALPSQSSVPLASRLDHLEFMMKYLERKQRWGSNACAEKQCMPLDLAVEEAFFKGSLLDRVAYLEHRLFQLCLEMDSSCSSQPLSRALTQTTSGESLSSQGCRGQIRYSSLPTFNNLPNQADKLMSQNNIHTLEMQERPERVQNQMKNASSTPQVVKNRPPKKKNENKSKDGKKQMPASWTHFKLLKLLGC